MCEVVNIADFYVCERFLPGIFYGDTSMLSLFETERLKEFENRYGKAKPKQFWHCEDAQTLELRTCRIMLTKGDTVRIVLREVF